MKHVAIAGTRGRVPSIPFHDSPTLIQRVGQNCGNLMFQYAVSNLIDEPTLVVGEDISWDIRTIREQCRVLAIPSANFLREGADFTTFVSFLEAVNLPLVFVGLGAQAESADSTNFDFHPSVLRLMDLIKERSPKIAIRGEFTARVLEHYGIHNFEITGCPSNFINRAENFPEMIASKLENGLASFITHADEPWPKNPIKSQVERKLVSWTHNNSAIMIQQAVPQLLTYLRMNNPAAQKKVGPNFEESLRKTLMPNATLPEFKRFLTTQLRTYYDVEQWMEDSSHFDFSIGLRLHGNMAAWQSGTPSLWITHDARTKELVETMSLPNVDIHTFLEKFETIEDAWTSVKFNAEAYKAKRSLLFNRLRTVLDSANIPLIE